MLELKDLHKKYVMGDNVIYALRGINLKIEQGDFVAIMGPSGSGKSTLMHVMGLLDVPDEGSYKINGREVAHLSEDELAILRREVIGFIFQQFNLLPRMTAMENVALPLLYSQNKLDIDKAKPLLERVGLGTRLEHKSNEMSGGQQQHVAIARSLINEPLIIFADEPTGNLDSVSEKEIMKALRDLNETGITIIVVTHEDEIGRQAKRLIKMRDGVIQSDERVEPLPQTDQKKIPKPTAVFTSGFAAKTFQHFEQAFKTLAANKVRTILSMLGILIGVAAVVAMLALGRGAQSAIENQLSSLGSNLLVLRPGASRGPGGAMSQAGSTTRLTIEDGLAIQNQVSNTKEVAPSVSGRGQVTYLSKNWSTQVLGVSPAYARMHASVPDVGRFFTENENKKRARVAVIGATIVRELFGDENPMHAMMKINKVSFQVIGILPEKGSNGFQDQDDKIIIPISTAMRRLLGKMYVDQIEVEVDQATNSTMVENRVLELMQNRHKIPTSQQQESFSVRNMADIQAALTSSTQTMTILLSVIAAISLLVGGIGIMNIMLVSVTERTREIGLRKAVGARRVDILAQFLVESVTVSAIGGSLGIFLAWLITVVLSTFVGWATTITVSSVCLAFFFSATVGVVFGIYPARKASLLPPIDALRYE